MTDQQAVFYIDDDGPALYRWRDGGLGALDVWGARPDGSSGWVAAAGSRGKVDGTGGDGHARRVSRDDARAFIDAHS